ncbi:MAG: PAS domain S-box protein [Gallionellaceae bacterium]|nr:PAS domain S-box protein [Gallionellaceae bacterium]
MAPTANLARTVAWLVALFVGVTVLAVPAGYSYITYRYMTGSLESETEVIAHAITQNIVSRNPVYWEFEQVRMEEYFSRLLSSDESQGGRIFNQKKEVIARIAGVPKFPVISCSRTLTDAGGVVGQVEISRSLRPLLLQTGLLGLIVIAAGLGMFAVLWHLPIRSLYRAQNLARQSEARYRGIFEYADDIICLLAPDGRFCSLNPAFARLTGWQPENWLGKPFAQIIHPDDLPRAIEVFRNTLAGHSTPVFALKIAKASGEYFDSELSIVPMDPGGEIAAICIARDVTERRQAEEQVRRLNEELEEKVQERTRQLLAAQEDLVRKEKLAVLGQVAGSVGHELRNPLGVMNNAVYFLQTVLSEADATTQEYLVLIKTEIATAERIVSDLLDSVRTKPPQAGTVWLAELIGQTLRKLPVPDGVTVEQAIPATLPPLRVDPQQVQQVLRNLISNGIDAMATGGTLTIAAAEADGAVSISVRDTGSGIAPEQMTRLFQPLYTTKARGIGLGLVVVKNLTEANGGRIEVQSEPGRGTVFTVTLPCAGPAEGAA